MNNMAGDVLKKQSEKQQQEEMALLKYQKMKELRDREQEALAMKKL